jgi:alpha-L-fucosidase
MQSPQKFTVIRTFLAAILASAIFAGCNAAETGSADAAVERATDVEWFRDARFGMFIHWGMSSDLGGIWNGDRYYGITEWLMRRGEIMSDDYKAAAAQFNPVDFDAAEWVSTAKAAGARYIVVTSKHHDGFAMFDSAASDFDIVDATPFGRDPLKELVDAAHAAGVKIVPGLDRTGCRR